MTTLREAAQMALKALEYYKHRNLEWDYADEHAIESLSAALAQTEQEPPCKTGSQCVGNKCERCEVQEREWQGLTNEDKREIINETEPEDRGYVMALIEAKLKEKNT